MATIRKRGSKYQVQVRRKGHKPLAKSFHTRKDAEAWARMIEVQVDRNELPDKALQDSLKQMTLRQLVVRYRDAITPTKRGRDCERIVLNAFLKHPICDQKLLEVGPVDFAEYRDERLKEVKPSTVRRQMTPLHHMYEIAHDEWGLPIVLNPLEKIRPKGADQRRERRLRQGEIERLAKACTTSGRPIIFKAIKIAIETAMRRGEILSIKWTHYDEAAQTLLIPHTKNGQQRIIPLSIEAQDILRSIQRYDDRAFPMTPNAFRLAWTKVRRRAGINDLRFHDLRHEAISRLFEKGLSVPEVALMSGHKDAKMLFRYTHPMIRTIHKKLSKYT